MIKINHTPILKYIKKLNYLMGLFTLLMSFQLHAKSNHLANNDDVQESVMHLESKLSDYLAKLHQMYPQAMIRQRLDRLGVSLMLKLNLELSGKTVEEQAQGFINQHQQLWGKTQVNIIKVEARKGHHTVHIEGEIEGRSILNQDSKLMIKDKRVVHVNNGIGALAHLYEARISEEEAMKYARQVISQTGLTIAKLTRGAVSYEPGIAYEVFELRVIQREKLRTWVVRLDGRDGAIISVKSGEQQ